MTRVPLYVVVIGSVLVGLSVSWIISLVNSLAAFFTLHGKESQLKGAQHQISQLNEQIRRLELENAQLRAAKDKKGAA